MMEDNISDLGNYRIVVPGVIELKLGDEWRAHWVDSDEMPGDAPVGYVYALVYRGDRGYVIRPRGSHETWRTVEGIPEAGESAEAFLERASLEQVGARVGKTLLMGYLECRATSVNPNYPAGAISVRPAYIVMAREMVDIPPDSPFERRRLSLSDHGLAIRTKYPELAGYFSRATQDYAVMVAKGEALA